jgi:hypothetical protein
MSASEALSEARAHGLSVHLNANGDGLLLESDGDPPDDLVELLRAAKPELIAYLREQHHAADDVPSANSADQQRRLIVARINNSFVSSPLDVCKHCGNGPKPDDPFVQMFVGDDSGAVHHGCWEAWQKADEAKARLALGLGAALAPEPEPNWSLYSEQVRLRRCDSPAADEEGRLRALEFTIRSYCAHHGCDLDTAKATVLAIIAAKGNRS